MNFKLFGYKLQLEVVIACMILGCLICGLTVCSCFNGTAKEGFENINQFLNGTRSSPDCCPSVYSNSTGCLCLSDEQRKTLRSRGGNASPA